MGSCSRKDLIFYLFLFRNLDSNQFTGSIPRNFFKVPMPLKTKASNLFSGSKSSDVIFTKFIMFFLQILRRLCHFQK